MSAATFRSAREAEVGLMLDWAAGEGWNPGLEDAAPFFASDAQGFFVAEVAGAPVGAISVVNHSETMAFLGFYLCRPAFRGRGIGFGLWRHALTHAGGRTVGLDGVAAQQANYAKSGFAPSGATLRLQGRLPPQADPHIRPVTPGDGAALAALDTAANGYARPAFLQGWTAPAATRQTVVLDAGGGPAGFAVIRACREGAKIGPIVAPDAASAVALAQAALAGLPAEPAIIDVPSDNAALLEALRGRGFVETFATARMYRGSAPATGPGRQAIGTLELG